MLYVLRRKGLGNHLDLHQNSALFPTVLPCFSGPDRSIAQIDEDEGIRAVSATEKATSQEQPLGERAPVD